MLGVLFSIFIFFTVFFLLGVRIVMEYDRGVVFRLGKYSLTKGPGLNWIIPIVDKMVTIDMRTITMDVPPQDVITEDNITIKVNAVVYLRVMNPENAITQVENYLYATSQLAQTTLRSILGQHDLDQILKSRDKINIELQNIIDKQTDPWGIKVSLVEIKHIDLPSTMQRAMAKQAEAERERRAKIIHAEGELQASEKLSAASKILGRHPAAIQLRFLQTLTEIATENNSTTIFPVPIDILSMMFNKNKEGNEKK